MSTPLKKGDKVKLLHEYPEHPVLRRDHEITAAGAAGFKVSDYRTSMLYWHDRGKTWSSDALDRIDATKTQFSEAVHGGVFISREEYELCTKTVDFRFVKSKQG